MAAVFKNKQLASSKLSFQHLHIVAPVDGAVVIPLHDKQIHISCRLSLDKAHPTDQCTYPLHTQIERLERVLRANKIEELFIRRRVAMLTLHLFHKQTYYGVKDNTLAPADRTHQRCKQNHIFEWTVVDCETAFQQIINQDGTAGALAECHQIRSWPFIHVLSDLIHQPTEYRIVFLKVPNRRLLTARQSVPRKIKSNHI